MSASSTGNKWSGPDLLKEFLLYAPTQGSATDPAKPHDKTVFISYSHLDGRWLKKVQTNLEVLNYLGLKFTLWDDTKIKSGTKWRAEIDEALAASQVAILLVSTEFMTSKFIQEDELPPLLKSAEAGGTTILPLILKPCLFTKHPKLSVYQAVNDPARPLSKLPASDQDDILVDLAERVRDLLS